MEDVKRILVAIRLSKYDGKAVHYAASLARTCGAELYLLHVIYDPFGIKGWNLPVPNLEEDYRREIEKAKKGLDQMIAAERASGLPIQELIREGEPAKQIMQTVQDEQIDVLVLLAHEEGKLDHLIFGHTYDEIIKKLPCSIFLVKKELTFG